VALTCLRTDRLSPRAGHRNCPKKLRLLKPTDMTIHWKALEDGTIISLIQPFSREKCTFIIFLK
jgi:hypothetical protein